MALGDAHLAGLRARFDDGHPLTPAELSTLAGLLVARRLAQQGLDGVTVRTLRVLALRHVFPDLEDPGADDDLGDPL